MPSPSCCTSISIHSTREGGDYALCPLLIAIGISIHSTREGGDNYQYIHFARPIISIHSTREGGDPGIMAYIMRQIGISIHSTREGGDVQQDYADSLDKTFQSTPPAKAETFCAYLCQQSSYDFNPLHPRRRRLPLHTNIPSKRISIHSTREGGDSYQS